MAAIVSRLLDPTVLDAFILACFSPRQYFYGARVTLAGGDRLGNDGEYPERITRDISLSYVVQSAQETPLLSLPSISRGPSPSGTL